MQCLYLEISGDQGKAKKEKFRIVDNTKEKRVDVQGCRIKWKEHRSEK